MSRPRIEVDRHAIRFNFADGSGKNLFWRNLFMPRPNQDFQTDVMMCLHKMYDECVKLDVMPETEDEEDEK